MTDLEPNIFLGKRARGRVDDIFEALKQSANLSSNGKVCESYFKRLRILGLLLINYTQPEVDLVCLFKFRLDVHDLGESLLGVVVATISVVENTDSVPEHGILLMISLGTNIGSYKGSLP